MKASLGAHHKRILSASKSHALLPISVGNFDHEGERFSATIDIVGTTFKRLTILVCDTLQRFTRMALGEYIVEEEACNIAKNAGKLWFSRHLKTLRSCKIPYELFHWDYWRLSPHFIEARNIILAKTKKDSEYHAAIMASVYSFRERYSRCHPHKKLNDLFERWCFEYLVEECAIMLLWRDLDFNYLVYPSKLTTALSETKRLFFGEGDSEMLAPVSIWFYEAAEAVL